MNLFHLFSVVFIGWPAGFLIGRSLAKSDARWWEVVIVAAGIIVWIAY